MNDSIRWETEDDDGDVVIEHIPALYEVCDRCNGRGSHVNPSIDGNGITSSEWENDWDDDEREMYLSGGYDVPCHGCHGLRVVLVPDEQRCPKELLDRYEEHLNHEAQNRAEEAYWYRLECRGEY